MNVVGNRSPDGYVFRTWAHRQKPSAGYSEIEDLRQGYPRFTTQHSALGVERDQAIEGRRLQQDSMLQQTNVAVTASHAHRQHFAVRDDGRGKVLPPEKGADFSEVLRITAPGFELGLVL